MKGLQKVVSIHLRNLLVLLLRLVALVVVLNVLCLSRNLFNSGVGFRMRHNFRVLLAVWTLVVVLTVLRLVVLADLNQWLLLLVLALRWLLWVALTPAGLVGEDKAVGAVP
jgi:hypothetical protein